MTKTESQQLRVIARSPFHIFYEGPAEAVTAKNKVGPFDILPMHADFFSMMESGEVTIQTAAEPVTFKINNGIITVRDDEVMLFVNM